MTPEMIEVTDSRRYYTDGELRPSWRGVLHLFVACLLPIGAVALLILRPEEWPLVLFLAGKECSYLPSGIFHRFAGLSSNLKLHILSRQCDKIGICISILAAGIPTSFINWHIFYATEAALVVPCAFFAFTDHELSAGEKSLGRKLFRVFMIIQFLFTITFIGWASTIRWNGVWIAGTSSYAVGFIMFGIGAAMAKGEGTGREHAKVLAWHNPERNGPHEDFHLLILIGDAFYLANSYMYGDYK